jgi:hypothetical protein
VGLDMYLEGHKTRYNSTEMEDGFPLRTKILSLGYWRKHPNLHGYIVQAFAEGVDECQDITLGAKDIRNIISAINGDTLPETSGFFFGKSESGKAQRKNDVTVFTKALKWLESVKVVQPEKIETEIGVMYKIEASDEIPNEHRYVVYRASW